ncbi:MAG: 1-acyl-sn-glycerol-3-phosphate acyltransferase [Acidobacteriota bacterium]|jgi:1-acyl-sn-glycerol-3-phosphate acyltransferase
MTEQRGPARSFARWAVRRFYHPIEVVDGDRVPQSGPIVLCANHANSLVDSLVVGIAAQRPVRFMAAAILFDVPVMGSVMRAVGMVPAFRGMDDQKQVRRNLESLDTGAGVLVEGHAMGIFPEGRSSDELHLGQVRTGAARMALQATEQGTKGVRIVPIGIAYERKERFRSAVLVRVAEPLVVAEVLAAEDGNVARARRALTQELDERLKSVVIHLENPDWLPWLDDLEVLAPPPAASSVPPGSAAARPEGHRRSHRTAALWQRKRIADAINWFWNNDRPRAESVAIQIAEYRAATNAAGLPVSSDILRLSGTALSGRLAGKLLWLLVLAPPSLLGALWFIVPFVLVRRLGAWWGEKGRTTMATHRLMFGIPIYAAWHAAGIFALWRGLDPRLALAWALLAPFCAVLALSAGRELRRVARLLVQETKVFLRGDLLRGLRGRRDGLRRELAGMAMEYDQVAPDRAD